MFHHPYRIQSSLTTTPKNLLTKTLLTLYVLLLQLTIYMPTQITSQTFYPFYIYDRQFPENVYKFQFTAGDLITVDIAWKCYGIRNVHFAIYKPGQNLLAKDVYDHCGNFACTINKTINVTNTYFLKVGECTSH